MGEFPFHDRSASPLPKDADGAKAKAFAALYRQHVEAIRGYCRRRLPRGDVDEAVSEVFSIAWRRFADLPADGTELFWLYGVARNAIRNIERGNRRWKRLRARVGSLGVAHVEPADDQIVRSETIEGVLSALDTLRPSDQEVLRLRTWEELDRHQIAAAYSITPEAADMRINRAVKRMAKALRKTGVAREFAPTAIDERREL